jgi:glycerol-3-phosphate dehydrogenase
LYSCRFILQLTDRPQPKEHEVAFILQALSEYLCVDVRPSDVQSVWAGIRPLALDPKKRDTQSISREHVVMESDTGLLTITGGKWTTYRKMAQDIVDLAVKSGELSNAQRCRTENIQVWLGINKKYK